jgi:predicted nucleic acid-binding protein
VTFLLFPDNTVLVNFALVSRTALLETLLAGYGRWTVTIAAECADGAWRSGLEDMALAGRFLGKPIVPTQGERIVTQLIRARLAGLTDKPTDHLGEAETFAVISSRALNAVFVTDDVRAARLARALELRTLSTAEVFKLAVHTKYLTADEAWNHVEDLRQKGRVLPHCPLTLGQFLTWCSRRG